LSGGKINWLIEGVGESLPSVDLMHIDLAGGEKSPEEHCSGFGRGQHGLGSRCVARIPRAAARLRWWSKTPSRRLATVADMIHAVFFLLDNQGVNGHDLEVDGGVRLV
jgi:hypothetical protein